MNCSTCFGPESDNCLSCSESTYLLEQICVDECPPQHYQFSAIHSCESTNFYFFNFILIFETIEKKKKKNAIQVV